MACDDVSATSGFHTFVSEPCSTHGAIVVGSKYPGLTVFTARTIALCLNSFLVLVVLGMFVSRKQVAHSVAALSTLLC